MVETKLARISEISRNNHNSQFISLAYLINEEMLLECYDAMDPDKAVGIDGVTKDQYGEHLNENIERLLGRMKQNIWRPKPARHVEILKDDGKSTRPISIYCFEDKLVQEAVRRILEAVYEPIFYDNMMGFRPDRGCHGALRKLTHILEDNPVNVVLDADITGYFNNLDQEWIMTLLKGRIKDPHFLNIVQLLLRAGIMRDYVYEATEKGAGQGSVCSPIIANIYMHYVVNWWMHERVMRWATGYIGLVIYADDFVGAFEKPEEAQIVLEHLRVRLGIFGLTLHPDKTRLIHFGRHAKCLMEVMENRKPDTFTFLGFTHFCGASRKGKFRVKRKTAKKKFAKKYKEVWQKIKKMRHLPVPDIVKKLNQILRGYDQYYGITDNYRALQNFHYRVEKALFYWLNRRSQKKSLTWAQFNKRMKAHPLIRPKIYVNIYEKTDELAA